MSGIKLILGDLPSEERSDTAREEEKKRQRTTTYTVTDYETRLEVLLSYTVCATFSLSAVQDNVRNMCKSEIVLDIDTVDTWHRKRANV